MYSTTFRQKYKESDEMKQMKMLAVKTETYVFSGHIDVDIVSNYITKEYSAWILCSPRMRG